MAEELRNLNCPVAPQQVVQKIVGTLPPSYRTFQSAWLLRPAAEQTVENLTTGLLGEEIMNNCRNGGEPDPIDVAFFAARAPQTSKTTGQSDHGLSARGKRGGFSRGRGSSRGHRGRGHHNFGGHKGGQNHNSSDQSNDQKGQVICFNCEKPGHKAYNCPEKRNEERKQARDGSFNKNRKSFGCISASFCLMAQPSSQWLADSGATHHMTGQRSFFTTYREIPPGTWKVNGIGGVELQAKGIGSIDITAVVNDGKLSGELREVLYVPGIGVSLFSIGSATAAGMEVLFTESKVNAESFLLYMRMLANKLRYFCRFSSQKTLKQSWLDKEWVRHSITYLSLLTTTKSHKTLQALPTSALESYTNDLHISTARTSSECRRRMLSRILD